MLCAADKAMLLLTNTSYDRRFGSLSSRRYGIKPMQSAKPRKITVCRAQGKPVFYGQRSQMSVWYEIAMDARQREKFAQQLGVSLRWLWYPCGFTFEP